MPARLPLEGGTQPSAGPPEEAAPRAPGRLVSGASAAAAVASTTSGERTLSRGSQAAFLVRAGAALLACSSGGDALERCRSEVTFAMAFQGEATGSPAPWRRSAASLGSLVVAAASVVATGGCSEEAMPAWRAFSTAVAVIRGATSNLSRGAPETSLPALSGGICARSAATRAREMPTHRPQQLNTADGLWAPRVQPIKEHLSLPKNLSIAPVAL